MEKPKDGLKRQNDSEPACHKTNKLLKTSAHVEKSASRKSHGRKNVMTVASFATVDNSETNPTLTVDQPVVKNLETCAPTKTELPSDMELDDRDEGRVVLPLLMIDHLYSKLPSRHDPPPKKKGKKASMKSKTPTAPKVPQKDQIELNIPPLDNSIVKVSRPISLAKPLIGEKKFVLKTIKDGKVCYVVPDSKFLEEAKLRPGTKLVVKAGSKLLKNARLASEEQLQQEKQRFELLKLARQNQRDELIVSNANVNSPKTTIVGKSEVQAKAAQDRMVQTKSAQVKVVIVKPPTFDTKWERDSLGLLPPKNPNQKNAFSTTASCVARTLQNVWFDTFVKKPPSQSREEDAVATLYQALNESIIMSKNFDSTHSRTLTAMDTKREEARLTLDAMKKGNCQLKMKIQNLERRVANLENSKAQMSTKLRKASQKEKYYLKRYLEMKDEVKKLNARLSSKTWVLEELEGKVPRLTYLLMKRFHESLNNELHASHQFDPEIKDFTVRMYRASPMVYNYVHNAFKHCIPCQRTARLWCVQAGDHHRSIIEDVVQAACPDGNSLIQDQQPPKLIADPEELSGTIDQVASGEFGTSSQFGEVMGNSNGPERVEFIDSGQQLAMTFLSD